MAADQGRRGFLKGLAALASAGIASKATAGLMERQSIMFGDDRTRRCVCGAPLNDCTIQETGQHAGAMTPETRGILVGAVDEEIEQPPHELLLPAAWNRIQIVRDPENGDWIINGETTKVTVPGTQLGRKLRAVLGGLALPERLPGRPRGYHFTKRRRGPGGHVAWVEFSDFRVSEDEAGLMEFIPLYEIRRADQDKTAPTVALWPAGTQHLSRVVPLDYAISHGLVEGKIEERVSRAEHLKHADVESKEFDSTIEAENASRTARIAAEGVLANAKASKAMKDAAKRSSEEAKA